MQIPVGEQALCQRAEGNDALAQTVGRLLQAVFLDGAVKDGVAVLVDDEGDVELVEDGAGFFQRLTVVVGQAGIKRLAAAHRLRQSTHGLFQRGVGVHAVVVENIHIVQPHALQAPVQAGQQILAAAEIPVRAGPHGISRFAGKHQLIPVGTQVFFKNTAEILLGSAGHRAVVVRHIDVRDAAVECGAQHGAHIVEGVARAEVVPQPQRNAGQLQAAFAAAGVLHRLITALVGSVRHGLVPLLSFLLF